MRVSSWVIFLVLTPLELDKYWNFILLSLSAHFLFTSPLAAVEDMIKEVDVDGDGRIDFYEFVHALGEPEDSQENEDDEELFSPLPKAITCNDGDESLSQ